MEEWMYRSTFSWPCTRRWVVSFTARPLYGRGKSHRYPFYRGRVGPRAGLHDVENIFDSAGTRTLTFLGRPACSQSLYWLRYPGSIVKRTVTKILRDHKHRTTNFSYVVFEVVTAATMKSTVCWDSRPCSLLKFNWRLGGTYCLLLHNRRIRQARYQRGILLGLFCDPEYGGNMLLRNVH
jgi:hypothetical protein